MVEFRKLIAFGKSSYVISLPKKWIERNKLKRGDSIAVDAERDKLVLSSKAEKEEQKEKTVVIDIDGKTKDQIRRFIIPVYINNFKNIILSGKDLKTKAGDIRDILHSLMALEIMEQSSEKIIAKDFLDMDTIDMDGLIRKMDNITKTMLIDLRRCFEDKVSSHIDDRENDVNRLSFVLFRSVIYNLDNPGINKQRSYTNRELLVFWIWGGYLEQIADNCKRIARIIDKASLKPKVVDDLKELLTKVENYYSDTLKSIHLRSLELSYKLAPLRKKLTNECNEVYSLYWNLKFVPQVLENLKETISLIHMAGRMLRYIK